ncbi:MAG: DUF4091 domain-containing protein [Planctomycetota bacterium]|nr:DUF4091 domain-containing protein [Planctomycetota bacterium]
MFSPLQAVVVALAAFAPSAAAQDWHTPYAGGGGIWRKRSAVDITNLSTHEIAGRPLAITVGTKPGEIALAGANAKDIRVCSATGVEYLFAVIGPDKQPLHEGVVRDGAKLYVPAELKPGASARYYVYFDNPSAWTVPDYLAETAEEWSNGFEGPTQWKMDGATITTEDAHSGKKSAKLAATGGNTEGPESTFLTISKQKVSTLSFWYKTRITAGIWWALIMHFDASGLPTVQDGLGHRAPLSVKTDSGGWKRFETTFGLKGSGAQVILPENTAKVKIRFNYWSPDGVNNGDAYVDDVVVEEKKSSAAGIGDDDRKREISFTTGPVENVQLKEAGATAAWADGAEPYRVPIEIRNYGEAINNLFASVNYTRINTLMQFRVAQSSLKLTDSAGAAIPHAAMENDVLFSAAIPASTAARYYLYFSTDAAAKGGPAVSYTDLLADKANLVTNPDFEAGDDVPEGWAPSSEVRNVEGKLTYDKNSPIKYALESPGLFGKRCVKMIAPAGVPLQWCGWRQIVKNVKPNTKYVYSGWVRAGEIKDGDVRLHGHFKNAAGRSFAFFSTPPAGTVGTMEQAMTISKGKWERLSTVVQTPPECAAIELHLTMHAHGTVWHDGILLAETKDAVAGPIEGSQMKEDLVVWQANPIAKVFKDSVPLTVQGEFRIASARNEREGLHLALRSKRDIGNVTVGVVAPSAEGGEKLDDIGIDRVDFVPVDFPMGYGNFTHPPYQRTIPTHKDNDGWEGLWPDPLIPHRKPLALTANTTQPFVITFAIPKGKKAGDYAGKVVIEADGAVVKTMPLTVTVWDFTLPDEAHVGAMFDLRSGPGWSAFPPHLMRNACKVYAEHRACIDMIRPEPKFTYGNGNATVDTTDYDKMAQYCFDELHMRVCYLPQIFYAFGWGFPPADFLGHKAFTPEYKDAYQKCLQAFWAHLKSKGWERHYSLYISDEPHFESKETRAMIVEQMQKLCAMIHEAVPEMRIYSSTWKYEHEWDGYLNHWGAGFYGCFAVEDMVRRQKAGDRFWFTTDGTFCLDTPYSSLERLYPYYCFKYSVEAYEFWGGTWWTYDPFRYGWHTSLPHTFTANDKQTQMIRYPNGDGYFLYPGWLIGEEGFLSSVRFEQVRDGVEDFEYLYLLNERIEHAKKKGKNTASAETALAKARSLVSIPNNGTRRSTEILKDPDVVMAVRAELAREIANLGE